MRKGFLRLGIYPAISIVRQPGRILIVEHDDLILRLLERWLGEEGYSVVTRTSQSLAEGAAPDTEPQLVIVDVPTPRSAEKIIRAVKEVHASPILLLSARLYRRALSSSIFLAHQLGVRDVLPKPFTRDELLSAVGRSIDRE